MEASEFDNFNVIYAIFKPPSVAKVAATQGILLDFFSESVTTGIDSLQYI